MKILIVDNDPDARKVLSLILKLDGFEVVTASGSQEALESIQNEVPDLLLLDVSDRHGHEVCRLVRANPGTAHLPVVMLSDRSDPDSLARGMDACANELLLKPIKPSNLTRQLRATFLRATAKPVLT